VPARSVEERAEACLESLLQVTPFQAGWIGLLDPERREHVLLPTKATTTLYAPGSQAPAKAARDSLD
jgi:hypothetical protein